MRSFGLALVALIVLFAPHAGANGGSFHPDLRTAIAHLDSARGPDIYTALREVWGMWDRADPAHVEEALVAAERDTRLTAPARAYAGLLVAYARARRGDLDAARKKIDALGYVRRFVVVGPFDNEGKGGLDSEIGPEPELDQAIVPGRAYSGKERPVRWRALPDAFPWGFVDFGALLRPERKVCAFAETFVRAKAPSKAPRAISIWVGVAGGFEAFWNGKKVLRDPAYRGHDADRFATTVTLAPGFNALAVKVCGNETSPVLSVRLADAAGAPDDKLETTDDLTASAEAAALMARSKRPKPAEKPAAGKPAAPAQKTAPPKAPEAEAAPPAARREKTAAVAARGGVEGPLQAFKRIAGNKAANPADLEAFARYLAVTQGDDDAEHEARDLARRAAERQPTIERLLLAGELAEDRNQRSEWIARAEAIAPKTGKQRVDVLLARAQVLGSGPSWREASSYYDKVLALDPDNLEALRGRAGG